MKRCRIKSLRKFASPEIQECLDEIERLRAVVAIVCRATEEDREHVSAREHLAAGVAGKNMSSEFVI